MDMNCTDCIYVVFGDCVLIIAFVTFQYWYQWLFLIGNSCILIYLSVSHTRLMTKLQPMYDPKWWESYLNHRNSARLVAEVVDDGTSKIGFSKVFKHVRRQSHQACDQVMPRSQMAYDVSAAPMRRISLNFLRWSCNSTGPARRQLR